MAGCGFQISVLSVAGEIVSAARSLVAIVLLLALLVSGCSRREGEVDGSDAAAWIAGPSHSPSGPRYAARLVCYLGEFGFGSNCSMIIHDPSKPRNANAVVGTRALTCGSPGKASEISWRFVGHRVAADVYHFEKRFPADALNPEVTSQEVAFDGAAVVVFRDEGGVTVLDTPK